MSIKTQGKSSTSRLYIDSDSESEISDSESELPTKVFDKLQDLIDFLDPENYVQKLEWNANEINQRKKLDIIEQDWSLTKIVSTIPFYGWETVFNQCMDDIEEIDKKLTKLQAAKIVVCPKKRDIFKIFYLCKPADIKVVIIGQDPYHKVNHDGNPIANGISFSVNKKVKIPPSLRKIYKELAKEDNLFKIPNHGDLIEWVKQGVFMFNTALTVPEKSAHAHKGDWIGFTPKVIKKIVEMRGKNVVFMLWGRPAQKYKSLIGGKPKILETSHPSPISRIRHFDSCNHFKLANQYLESVEETPINWNCLV